MFQKITDPSSASNLNDATVQHIHLQWDVDFTENLIKGRAFLDVLALEDTSKIELDARDLTITEIKGKNGILKFSSEEFYELGQKISIQLGETLKKDENEKIEIAYSTSNQASALQFMNKELTSDKTKPYLYSQCQAIHARSLVPLMDSPSVKQSYSAEVTVPKGVVCLMSGLSKGSEEQGDKTLFRFEQPVAIPSYLLAIVAGDLAKRDISPRCCVWAEPSVVDKAHWEFQDAERMLQAAEQLMGKYEWGRYDLVVLPPSFSFGGMENPCLTFVTPTLLVGDRSMVNVIAHEIAHSWTGNLVTNANWEHFWLNEGFTVFVERKILGRLYGEENRDFASITGWEDKLHETIVKEFSPVHEYTKLCPNLPGIDPDDAFCRIPYEKGSAFLLYLEQLLGSKERFEQMLRDYIKKYSGKSVMSQDWIQFLKNAFPDKQDVLDKVDFDSWLNRPGFPPNKPKYNEELVAKCVELAKQWTELSFDELETKNADAYEKMSTDQKIKVLNVIYRGTKLPDERIELLAQKYGLNESNNFELLLPYIQIGIKAKWPPIIPKALKFVQSNGRIKYLKPVYADLLNWEESHPQAIATFKKDVPFMHPITIGVVSNLIKAIKH